MVTQSDIPLWFETLNVIYVIAKYRAKCGKILIRLRFIQYEDIFYNNNDLRTIDVNKT